MNQQQRAWRVGRTAVAWALVFRLFDAGAPGVLLSWLAGPGPAAFVTYLETGRDVRFSPSLEGFSPDFMETPASATLDAPADVLPAFSDAGAIAISSFSAVEPDMEALLTRPLTWDLTQGDPAVLIVHTHSTESYTRAGEDYAESAAWRTLDEGYNMLSIGAEVARLLEAGGVAVLQDRQLQDYPSYNGSYTRTRAAIQEHLAAHPSIALILDLHRDASDESAPQMRTTAQLDGGTAAQLMVVVGTNHEGYEENLSLGLKLHAQLQAQCPDLVRPLQLRASRFNQDLSPGALLIEVGAAGNTHPEALLAAQQLAQAILALAKGTADTGVRTVEGELVEDER